MRRIFLGGTTKDTVWRSGFSAALIELGVDPDAIHDPVLPTETKYTDEYAALETAVKDDPSTIIVINLCPGVVNDPNLTNAERRERAENTGVYSSYEIGQYGFAATARTAIVLNLEAFSPDGRPAKILRIIREDLSRKLGSQGPPLFPSLHAVAAWAAPQLPRSK